MFEIYTVNGEKYKVSPDRKKDFLAKFPNAQLFEEPGKTPPTTPDAVVEETAASNQPSMELDSVDTSLELQEPISIRKKQRLQELEKISLNSINQGTTSSLGDIKKNEQRKGFLGSLVLSLSKIPANLQKQEIGIRDFILLNLDKLVNPGDSREERIKRLNEYWNNDDDPMIGFPGLGIIQSADTKEEAVEVIKEIRNKQRKTETESLSKAFKEGDYTDSAFLAADGLIQALPSIAFSMYGAGGFAVHGALIAGEKWGDEILENPESTELAIAGNAIATGALQAASDWAFRGLLKNAGVVAKETSAKAAKEYLKNGFLQTAKKFAVIPGEGATEVVQNIANKYLDLYTLGKEFKFSNIKNELIDEFVIGTLMSGGVTLASYASGASDAQKAYAEGVLMPEDQKAKLNFYVDKYNELGTQYSNESNDLSRKQIGLELKNVESNISSLRRKYRTALYSMNSEQLNEYAKNKDKILKIKENIDLSSTPEGRNILFKEIDILNQNNNEIIQEAVKIKYNETTAKAEKEAEKLGVKFTKFEKAIEYQNYLESLGGNELYSSNEGVIVQKDGKQEIIINEEAAQDNTAVNVAAHELLHAVLYRTLKGKDATSVKLGDALINQISKININKVKDSDLANRLRNYLLEPEAIQGEEALTLFSDALATGDIQFNNNIFNSIGDGFRRILQNKGFKSIKFDTGRDVYNFIKDYNKNVEKNNLGKAIEKVAKEGARGKLVSDTEATAGIESILKESRSQEASDRVQKIYDAQGITGAFEIIEEFKPITLKITRKRREAPNYDEELLSSEIEIGKGGLLDLIKSYNPESGVPLAAYINKNLPLRAIAASKRMLGEQFTEDVTELRDVAIQEEISRKEEIEERKIAEEIKSLRKQIGLSEDLVARTKDAVIKTFGTKLPSPEDPKFKLALQNAFRVELKKPIAKFVGRQADYENFLRNNFEVIYDKLTINTIAKRFRNFAEPVIDKRTGKQAREKTDEGNKIFKKKKLTKAEFIGYFLGSNVGRSTQGTRKTAIVEAIAEEIAFDATMEVLRDPMVTERYLQISELIGDPLPENFKSLIAKQIDRGEDFKFSKSILNISKNEYGLNEQELSKILNNTNLKKLDAQYSLIADNIIYEANPVDIKFSLSTKADSKWEQNPLNPLAVYDKKYDFKVGEINYQISIITAKEAGYDYEIFEGSYGLEDNAIINDQKSVALAFSTESGRTGITGDGVEKRTNAFKVFGIVGNSVIDLIKKDNLNSITFTAKEESRQRLYQSLSNKFAEELGWEIYDFVNDDGGLSFLVYDPKITSEESVVLNTPSIKFSKSKDYQFTAKDVLANAKAWRNFSNKHFEQSKIYQEKIGDISKKGGAVRPSNIINRNIIKNFDKLSSEEKKIVETKIEEHRQKIINYKTKNKKSIRPENIYYKSPAVAYGKNYESIKENIKNGKIFELTEAYSKIYTDMWVAYFEILKENPDMYDFLEMSLQTSNNDVAHWQRLGARFTGVDPQARQEILKNKKGKTIYRFTTKTGKKIPVLRTYEFEHAVQNHLNWSKNLELAKKLSKKENGKELYIKEIEKAKENYTLFALSVSDARKVDKAGYSLEMPTNWKTFLDRYFNPKVSKINGGIDTEKISIIKYENSKAIIDDSTVKSVYNINNDGSQLKYSKSARAAEFNKIIERATGFKTRTKLAEVKADKLAKNKGKFRFFIPPSADDFAGLLYYITGKGKQGDADMQYFKETFFDPFAKGIVKFDESKQRALANFKELKKLIRKTPARLSKQNETGFTNEEVARIYIWDSLGYDIPGLTKKDIKEAVKFVKNNNELLEFAQNVKGISVLGYPKPDNGWIAGTMTTDLLSYVNETVRADFLKDWKTNVDATLKKPDVLNKLKATYGENYTEALEDILFRMETGRRRPMGNNKLTNQVMNWVNDSVGAIMFFNTRSALLQQLSFVNFINFSDNNPLKAGATFTNQKQFWADYANLFNSDFLKQRRSGLKTDVNADEIAKAAESGKNPIRSVIASILKKGFLPTQFADSHAIALGGASFYRNRINRYKKEGKLQQEAEQQAFLDFQEIAEETQQSSRPDRISMQQASPLGRIILAFANTPMQYARLTKKAALDLANGRGDWKTNLSKLMYYSFIQNVIFTALQGAMFAMIFDETDDEEKEKDKYYRAVNNISDSLLRGLGFGGAAVATSKNMILEAIKQYKSKRPDYTTVALKSLSLSPPIDSKIRKLQSAGRTFTYRQSKEKIFTEGLSLDNPAFEAVGQIIAATTNLPADRVIRKMDNLSTPIRQDVETWQAISLALGYSKWDVGLIETKTKKPTKKKQLSKKQKEKKRKKQTLKRFE